MESLTERQNTVELNIDWWDNIKMNINYSMGMWTVTNLLRTDSSGGFCAHRKSVGSLKTQII